MTQVFEAEQSAPGAGTDSDEEGVRDFLKGALADKLGLTAEQLRVGLTLARNHLVRGAYDEAFRNYVGLVLCRPMEVDFQLGLANCASLVGQHHLAIQAASAVIAMAPTNPRGFLMSGRGCLAIGAVAEAREDLADAIRLAKASGDAVAEAEARKLLEAASAQQA